MAHKNAAKQCICEICNCGRHRCPHRTVVQGPVGPCATSEYSHKYVLHGLSPVTSCKPAAVTMDSEGPMSDQTTSRVDFVRHPIERRQRSLSVAYEPPQGSMEASSVYAAEYTFKEAARALPVCRDVSRRTLGRFEGEPTYRSDYRQWPLCKSDRVSADLTWQPSKDKFDGVATYSTDFVGHTTMPSVSCKPEMRAFVSDAPLDDLTDYRQSYVRHQLKEQHRRKERSAWTRSCVPFEGLTTFKRDFTCKEHATRTSYKPVVGAFRSTDPLASETTSRVDYRAWRVERPLQRQYDCYTGPDGEMDLHTTYVEDYPLRPLLRSTARRPVDRRRELGPFTASTDYGDNYRQWNSVPRQSVGPRLQYRTPSEPFEGQSTQQAHFVQHALRPRTSCRPHLSLHSANGAFDDRTVYGMDYTVKQSDPCPAALIGSAGSSYLYSEQNKSGHNVYEYVNGTLTDTE